MIIKSFEIQKKTSNFLKYKLFLLYGENEGLKKLIERITDNVDVVQLRHEKQGT